MTRETSLTVELVEVDALTPAEFKAAVEAFSNGTLLRLQRASVFFGRLGRTDPDDLLQDAYFRGLNGERQCPRDVSVITFLRNTMRSLAHAARKSRRQNLEVATNFQSAADGNDTSATEFVSDGPTPEELAIEQSAVNNLMSEMEQLFADDPDAQLVLVGLCEELTRQEILVECELTGTQYATIRTRIRRTLEKHYPKGWEA